MQEHFYELADSLTGLLTGAEVLLVSFAGEQSDFVRFNRSRIRQAGSVRQGNMTLELISGPRHGRAAAPVTGHADADRRRGRKLLEDLRGRLPHVPEDPYLLYATEARSGEQTAPDRLGDAADVVDAVLAAGAGRDLVGLHAQGGVFAGFANSLGQRNWFSSYSFHLDFSLHLRADKAVKAQYAGFEWDPGALAGKVDSALEQLAVLERPARTIDPGRYRVYLAPAALGQLLTLMCWGGFGLKAHRTKTTSLLRMIEEGAALHPSLTVRENTREGIAPNFQSAGFTRPDEVALLAGGRLGQCLVSPRSGKEYGVETNAANVGESPESLDVAAGELGDDEVLARLGTGVYANRLWYLNYSDRPGGRITGMTRFATFWVEAGRIAAPLNVMRFDETVYRALGENLLGLTRRREFIPSSATYVRRATDSIRTPGALIDAFHFTL